MNSQLLLAFGSLFYGEVSQVDVAFGFLCLEGNRENLSLEKDYSSKFLFSLNKLWFLVLKKVDCILAVFDAMVHIYGT